MSFRRASFSSVMFRSLSFTCSVFLFFFSFWSVSWFFRRVPDLMADPDVIWLVHVPTEPLGVASPQVVAGVPPPRVARRYFVLYFVFLFRVLC
jgi:hypothetical protein